MNGGFIMDKKKIYIIGGIFILFLIFGILGNSKEPDTSENTTEASRLTAKEIQLNAEIASIEAAYNSSTQKAEASELNLNEKDYKAMCKELWHDDIFFSSKNIKEQYVKLDLFAEEARYFNTTALSDKTTSDFIKKYDIKRDFMLCGINRKDANSYVGGQITVYLPNSLDITLKTGGHYIAYGQIVEYSTTTFNGYNKCSFLPKYIEAK